MLLNLRTNQQHITSTTTNTTNTPTTSTFTSSYTAPPNPTNLTDCSCVWCLPTLKLFLYWSRLHPSVDLFLQWIQISQSFTLPLQCIPIVRRTHNLVFFSKQKYARHLLINTVLMFFSSSSILGCSWLKSKK